MASKEYDASFLIQSITQAMDIKTSIVIILQQVEILETDHLHVIGCREKGIGIKLTSRDAQSDVD
ncbi:hypothetical protein K0M31_002165 [Melipona bicolor]|uniref:Uncharacterized protein n=1 Tax=Melipona bicolor TaxID=60889 RepID=A0AA40GH43_9HYME|nr:hypothetical protein K0M31_002165 [Melipona bicolor]